MHWDAQQDVMPEWEILVTETMYMTYDGHCISQPVTRKGTGSIFMQCVTCTKLLQVDLWYRQETERKHYVRNELEVKKEKEM